MCIFMYHICMFIAVTINISCTVACRIEILWRFRSKPNNVAAKVYFLFAYVYSRCKCSCFETKPIFTAQSCLTSHPALKLKDQPFSVVRDCLFGIFAVAIHIEGRSSTCNTRTRHALVIGTHFWWGNVRGKRPLGRPRRRWEDNIKMDLQKVGRGVWTGSSWLRLGTGGGHLWMLYWTSGSIKCGEFLDWLRAGWLLKKDSVTWSK
jgi:hypothetical protein